MAGWVSPSMSYKNVLTFRLFEFQRCQSGIVDSITQCFGCINYVYCGEKLVMHMTPYDIFA